MIGAVVPVFNRRSNLELLLRSLERSSQPAFEVVVSDDGSTDGTRAFVQRLQRTERWAGRLKWVGAGPNRGVRTGRARNIGAANLDPAVDLVVMLDSDLLLQPDAIAAMAAAYETYPGCIVLGPVSWLPPLDHATVLAAVVEGRLDTLLARVPREVRERVEGTFVGPELRDGLLDLSAGLEQHMRAEWALPLNSAWPVELYWRIGGFDETMQGYGYQDMDLGARAAAAGARCVFQPELWALHVWHPKPAGAMVENQRNLDRYLRRHGPNRVIETDVDWTIWWHYHRERGGTVVRRDFGLWAVNAGRDRRLALPDASWLERLGHRLDAVSTIDAADLDVMSDCGTARAVRLAPEPGPGSARPQDVP